MAEQKRQRQITQVESELKVLDDDIVALNGYLAAQPSMPEAVHRALTEAVDERKLSREHMEELLEDLKKGQVLL